MESFRDLVKHYQQREKSTLMDTITVGLSFADEVSVSLGLMEDTGLLSDILDSVSLGLPFAVVALTEGSNVLFKKKAPVAGAQDAAFRMVKTGAAMGAGAAVAAAGAVPATLPVAMGVRLMFDRFRSRGLTGLRVQQRTQRLKALNTQRRKRHEALSPQATLLLES